MAKQLLSLRQIYKIPSSEIVNNNLDLVIDYHKAREQEMIISVASSQAIRFIDEIRHEQFGEEEFSETIIKQLKKEIKQLKRAKDGCVNRRKLSSLYDELQSHCLITDYMAVIMDSNSDYDELCMSFKVNGIRYERFMATTGGVKNKTILFASERMKKPLLDRCNNGRDMEQLFVPAKLQAYMSLMFSASTPVTNPSRILVVDDVETTFTDDVIEIDDSSGLPSVEFKEAHTIKLGATDGCGMISPQFSQQWADDLHLDYLPSGYCTRFSFTKGMLFTFDFVDFAEKVAGTYMVKDVWGHMRDIREVDVVLTTNQLKLWDAYESLEHFMENSLKNNYKFAVTKATPKFLSETQPLNYQFIQSYELADEDIEELIRPTLDLVHGALGEDYAKTMLFLKGVNQNENSTQLTEYTFIDALSIEPKMLQDPHVRDSVLKLMEKRINRAKMGVLMVDGNFSVLSGDLYLLCEHMFGLEPKGLLQKGKFYSKFWNDKGVKECVAFRAPMSNHNNIRIFEYENNEQVNYWFRYMGEVTVLNGWDTTCHALNGCDFDMQVSMSK